MKRIDVLHGGNLYSLGGRDLAEVQTQIASFGNEGGWFLVNDGEGSRRDAYLWVSSATPIALVPIPDELPD